jgi:hypothetical protein
MPSAGKNPEKGKIAGPERRLFLALLIVQSA